MLAAELLGWKLTLTGVGHCRQVRPAPKASSAIVLLLCVVLCGTAGLLGWKLKLTGVGHCRQVRPASPPATFRIIRQCQGGQQSVCDAEGFC